MAQVDQVQKPPRKRGNLIDRLADLPRPGLPRRLTEHERGRIIHLAGSEPPGRLQQGGEGLLAPDQPEAPAQWTLDALAQAAQAEGIRVGRSQVRRILLAEGARWRHPRSWTQSTDPASSQRAQVIACYTTPPPQTTVICADELGPVIPRSFPPAPGSMTDGHRVKAVLDYGRGPEKTWVYGALRPCDGQEVTMTAPSRNSAGYQQLLTAVEAANPAGDIVVITDNLSAGCSFPRAPAAEAAGGLVAAVSPSGACRAVVCHPGGDHPGHRGGDLPAQRPRPPVALGPPAPSPRHRRRIFTYRI